MSNQVTTTIKVTHTDRDRKTVFWRGILVFPVFIFVATFSQAALQDGSNWDVTAAGVVFIPTVLALLFRQVYPSYVLTFNHAVTELGTRLSAYLFLLNDEYPSIERNPNVAVIFPDIEGGAKLNRGLPLVKWVLAIPHYVVGAIYVALSFIVTVIAWVQTSATGKYPAWAGEIVLGTIAYINRVEGYMLLLVTDEYPTFRLK
ncbi:MAG: hypothetical protein F2941_01630 [Actinobacteria bacterium]|uniref:Unannotated protein n=1 Tax=freshwater metagenome TaxID=449393 RepID=A0A6J7U7X5_9ZZZZ|nr:hypothetical protein [Actinomycetota bacterium]